MPRVRRLKILSDHSEYILIAISCRLKDYRVVHGMNIVLGLDFKKNPDFIVYQEEEELPYSFYFYKDQCKQLDYFFISNHHPEAKLIKELKQADYFLLINNQIEENELNLKIRKLKNIPGMLAVLKVDYSKIKQISLFFEDLELQMLG